MLKQSWFAVSPSPWSLAFYVIMGIIGGRQLLKQGIQYKRYPKLMAFLDAIFILGIIVFIQDSIWLLVNTWKWIIPIYWNIATFQNYWIRFPQNIMGALLCLLMSWGLWRSGLVSFKKSTLAIFEYIGLMTFAVFFLAPNQAWTDWTFAVSHHFSDRIILESFIISHVGYKALIALAYLSLFHWRIGEFKKEPSHNGSQHGAIGNEEDFKKPPP